MLDDAFMLYPLESWLVAVIVVTEIFAVAAILVESIAPKAIAPVMTDELASFVESTAPLPIFVVSTARAAIAAV